MAGLFQFILKRASQSHQGVTVDDTEFPQWASEPVASLVRYPLVWQRCRKLPQSGADIFCWSPLPLFIYPPDGRASLLSSHPVCFLTFHRLSSTTPWVMLLFFFLSKVQSFKQCVYILLWWGWRDTSEGTACWLQNMASIFPMDVITGEILLPLVRSSYHRFLPSWVVPSWAVPSWVVPSWAMPSWAAPPFALLSMGIWHNSAVFLLAPLPWWPDSLPWCSAQNCFFIEVLVWQERSTEKSGSSMETENSFPSQYKDIMHVWPETEGAVTWRKTDRDREAQW